MTRLSPYALCPGIQCDVTQTCAGQLLIPSSSPRRVTRDAQWPGVPIRGQRCLTENSSGVTSEHQQPINGSLLTFDCGVTSAKARKFSRLLKYGSCSRYFSETLLWLSPLIVGPLIYILSHSYSSDKRKGVLLKRTKWWWIMAFTFPDQEIFQSPNNKYTFTLANLQGSLLRRKFSNQNLLSG